MVKKAAQAKPNYSLKAARRSRGWTQQYVADQIGSPLALNVTRWERGTAAPSAYYVQRLCQLFEMTPQVLGLLTWEDAESTPTPSSVSDAYWNVPYRRNPFFTGRGDLLAQLGEQLRSERSAALTQSYALSGLGGIGKTQLAVEYAYRAREQYQAIFWVRAGSRETLLGDFVSIAELLSIPTASVQDQMQIVETVKRRLAEMGGWLLILDNADDLSLLQDFLPAGEGHVLLTTRAQATATIAISIAVEKMDLDEGTLLLLTRAKLLAPFASLGAANAQNLALGRTLVGLLDGLPLALDQAGAYIEESGCDLQEYLTSYRQHRRELLARRGAVAMNYPHSVVSTWALSFQQVEQAKPSAADILRLCAFLDPDAIPERLLAEGAAVLGPRLAAVIGDPLQWNEALSVLRQYSLLHRDGERKMLSLHRLVQAVLKDEMEEEERRAWAERAVQAVAAAFPEPLAEHWPRCQQYLPHAQVCAELIAEYHLVTPETSLLLLRSGQYLGERGQYEQAEAFLGRAVAQREQMGGLRQIAQALVQLGHLYLLQGRYEQAEQVLQRALGIDEQELGPEHLATAEALHYLANVYHLRYQYEQAEALYLRVLRLREGAVGESELTMAQTLSDLALHYQYHHHYERAEVVYQRALAMYERVAGPEHPDFVITLHNFGSFYRSQQRYEQAEQVLQRALSLHERVFGPEHPHTGNVLGELGDLCRERGQYEQAEAYLQRALVIKERALGPQHPYTGYALDSLAFLYSRQGRYEQAAGFYRRAAAVLTRDTLRNAIFFYDMACFYDDWCHYEQAESLLRRSLSIRERDLGPGHPDCMEVRERYERVRLKLKLQT